MGEILIRCCNPFGAEKSLSPEAIAAEILCALKKSAEEYLKRRPIRDANNGGESSTVLFSTVQCSSVQFSAVQCSSVQFSAVQYSTVQYSIVQYSPLHVHVLYVNLIIFSYG